MQRNHSSALKTFIAAFGRNGLFLYRAFSVFSPENLIGFLKAHGVPTRVDADGKVFPADDKAQSVLAALSGYLRHGNVHVACGLEVAEILAPEGTQVKGVKLRDGYAWAKRCGHSIVPLRSGLTALVSEEPFIKELQGLTLKNILIPVLINGRRTAT